MAEFCATAAVEDVGHHGELAAAAKGVAVYGAEERFPEAEDCGGPIEDEFVGVGRGEGQVAHFFDVCTGCGVFEER